MSYEDFVAAYHAGSIRVNIDRAGAARYLSARLLLPLFTLPVLGLGTALAILGWLWAGFGLLALGTIGPLTIKRGAPHFVITHALADKEFYDDVMRSGLLEIKALN